jgi:hypothetical protein
LGGESEQSAPQDETDPSEPEIPEGEVEWSRRGGEPPGVEKTG